ncbi:hypothetical protein H6P81_012515 [Aristolochia fimbriata]|uniref:Aminotransferase-like plant mobile domain-containing protein n=1 Tax=Aristolochia fimbriata TaxID=158543 RepID=A0AAV7EFB1_ARIFI|nr:hypothetical protein H6P81_012515 [Aristolochia fimbriata]
MQWELLHYIRSQRPNDFQELVTKAHNMENLIEERGEKTSPSAHPRKKGKAIAATAPKDAKEKTKASFATNVFEPIKVGSKVERPTDECHKPWWKPGVIKDIVGPPAELSGRRIWLSTTPLICFEIVKPHVPDRVMLQFGLDQVTPPEDIEHVTHISRKGRAGEDWAVYHHDYITRWEARAECVVTGSRAHTPKHAPRDYMMWYLGVTRRFVSPPSTEPAMLGCVRNVVERVNHTEVLEPSPVNPSVLEIRHYCQSVLHSLPLLEGAIVDRDVSHPGEPSHVVEPTRDRAPQGRRARRRPTAEMTTRVEDSDEVPAVPEPMVPDLLPGQTLEPELDQPLQQPLEPEPSCHPRIRRIYTRSKKKQLVHQSPVIAG